MPTQLFFRFDGFTKKVIDLLNSDDKLKDLNSFQFIFGKDVLTFEKDDYAFDYKIVSNGEGGFQYLGTRHIKYELTYQSLNETISKMPI